MPSYQEYQAQIAELQRKAEQARKEEIADARNRIATIMRQYNLGIADLLADKSSTQKMRGKVEAKYRNNVTGETWTGRGRSPRWMEGQNKERFLIKQ